MKKLGDPAIAVIVVVCSVVLFLALSFALQGNPFDHPNRTLRAQFSDVTGVQPSSLVKYAGASAGNIHSIRMLTPEERASSAHPENIIEVVIALNKNVPALNKGLVASISSDTLLSEKFVLLSGGDPKAETLANGAIIDSIAPVTFDTILRDLSIALTRMQQIFGGSQGNLDGILPKLDQLLVELDQTVAQAQNLIQNTNKVVNNGDGLITNANQFVTSGRSLIDTNKSAIHRTITQFSSAANSLEQLAKRTDQLIKNSEGNLTAATVDAKTALRELKAAAISARALADSLRARPQQLIWGPGRQKPPTN